MASGGNDRKHIDTSPPTEAYVLYGAAVGGPNKKDEYYDLRDYWIQTEVSATSRAVRPWRSGQRDFTGCDRL